MIHTLTRRMSPGKLVLEVLPLGLALLLSSARAEEAQDFDFARYRLRPVQDLLRDYPAQSGLVITHDVPIRSRVVYSGEFRDLPDESRRLIGAWANALDVPVASPAFRRELRIIEARREYWLPVQEMLVPAMQAELRPGEEIEVFVIYIGQVDGRHVLLVNAFDHESPHRAPR